VTTREVGERPEHITGTPEGDVLLVSVNTGSNKILMLDPTSFETLAEIDVWSAPHTLLVSQGAHVERVRRGPVSIEANAAEDSARGER
jgi:hypothetical protein